MGCLHMGRTASAERVENVIFRDIYNTNEYSEPVARWPDSQVFGNIQGETELASVLLLA